MSENGELAQEYHPQRTPSPSASPPSSPKHSSFHIRRELLPIKGYYFFFMAAVGDLLPFIAIYMQQLGLTSQETGVIYGIMPFVGFFIRPVIGAISDKFKKHKLVLILVTTLSGLFYFLLVFVPHRSPPPVKSIHTTFECNNQDSFFQDCRDLSKLEDCDVGLTSFANSTEFSKRNASQMCTISCENSPHQALPEFWACLTNDTGPYSKDRCNGTLIHSRHLNFTIPDLERLIASEVVRDRYHIDDMECWDYDIKDVEFGPELSRNAWQILCERELTLDCTVNCSQREQCKKPSQYDTTFFAFFFIFLIANIAFAPIFPILDAAAYEILAEDRHLWGKQRVWGTFGFALFAVTSTFIMFMQRQQNKGVDYAVSFYLFLPLCIIAAIVAYFMRMSSDIKCGQFVKNVCQLLCHKEVSAFLFVVMYFGMLTGGLETFLFWYLGLLGSSPLVFGFILLVNCLAEVPLLWVAGAIIKKTGLVSCLYLALACYGIRMIVYSIIQEPWLVLLVEPLHGVCFGLMYAAASSYASIIAPPGMSATVQGLLGGVHFGFGKGIGSLLTGFMFGGLGPRWTWRVYSIVSAILLVLYICLNKLVFKPDHHPPVRQPAGTEKPSEQAKQRETLINSSQHKVQENSETVA